MARAAAAAADSLDAHSHLTMTQADVLGQTAHTYLPVSM